MRSKMDPKTRLADGNAMFRRTMDPSLLSRLAKAHEPFVAIVTCSDARVDPAKVFNLSLGDAFVVRTAGNTISDPTVIGSIEYAVKCLEVKAVVIMGHTDCGAVKATYSCREPDNLDNALGEIECAKSKLDESKARDASVVAEQNVRMQLRKLEDTSTVVRSAVSKGKLEMIGAMLDLETGTVRFI